MSTAEHDNRERSLAEAFVGLADTLVAGYDVIELLHRLSADCVALLPVDAAGLMLSDQRGRLTVAAYSTGAAHDLEQFQLRSAEGPCVDCFHDSTQVVAADLAEESRWPQFTPYARDAGYLSVHAFPLRLRAETIGALNLFGAVPAEMSADDRRIGQALADVATIGIIQERAIARRDLLAEQLEGALNSRVTIEQAKGVIAERRDVDMTVAFDVLRRHARATNRQLTELARAVVDDSTVVDDLPPV
ncbi:GAF and ANTAR domain-containing protein [Pseudonocardia abyssalis]|jgi:GAF domain-containing protein|uniref:GAF and ANTAR domain-containing protein n=1 Tax=Pseudonocardia abyssalis TaxID=2792008 RepID=A0ABS6V175_9PSEU|nr:GAF and ANTAR domain-containing protein [Pseudonocardia abyssalis]MBW0115961.1 GAF and ANTAR domain-containing protein [Pseudonocardia abyssalis]MBW0137996.1 GAF and ANTAR domain-containing protein [Pseudonocardia abyssalis]